jgi:hypothetical protein
MAINFPNTPVNGSTYDYLKVRYTYTKPNAAYEGYWRVTTPGSVGIATSNEISAGVDGAKYVTPLGLVGTVEWDQIETNRLAALQHITTFHTPDSVSGSTVFTNSDNNINIVGVGNIGLEIGDVIIVTNSALNGKVFTVEFTPDGDNIIVNAEHAGGTTTKSLVDETANATITLLVKAASAGIGTGQGWVVMTNNGRLVNGTYDNDTGRSFQVHIALQIQSSGSGYITIDGVQMLGSADTSLNSRNYFTHIIGPGSSYRVGGTSGTPSLNGWFESR